MSGESVTNPVQESRRLYPSLWVSVAVLVFFFAYSAILGESPDWENYDNLFDSLRVQGAEGEDEDRIEIGFKFFSLALIGLSFSNAAVFAIIAATSAFLKSLALNMSSRSCSAFLCAMVFSLVCFAPLHELTQLRAALAIAFLYAAYVFLIDRRYLLMGVSCAIALMFHISAAIMFPLFFMVNLFDRAVVELTRARAMLLGTLVFIAATSLIAFLIVYFEEVLLVVAAYQQFGFGDEPSNPFSASILLNLGMVITGLILWEKLSGGMRYVLVFQLIGVGIFYATLDFQVVAHRVYELIQTFWVFYIVDGVDNESSDVRSTTWGFVAFAVTAYSYIYVFSGNFFL